MCTLAQAYVVCTPLYQPVVKITVSAALIIKKYAGQDPEWVLVTEKEAADFLGYAPGTLTNWRCTGRYKIPFIKSGRNIRYRLSVLMSDVENNTFRNTAEAQEKRREAAAA